MSTSRGRLVGQVAMITGASKGIGRAIVLALAREGANVVAIARGGGDGGRNLLEELGDDVQALGAGYEQVPGDVRQAETARKAVAIAMARFGRIDILVNNAGVGATIDFTDCDEDLYNEIMDTSMRGTFLFTAGVVPIMKEEGRGLILQIASTAGIRGFSHEAVYCAAKHAQVGFTRGLRLELQPLGIKVEVICPAGVKTDFSIGRGRTREAVAASGFMEPSDVAAAVLFVATQPSQTQIGEMSLVSINQPLQF